MKNIALIVVIGLHFFAVKAQDQAEQKEWKHSFQIGANLNQSSFSKNWKAGGVNNIAWGTFFNLNSKLDKKKWNLNSDFQSQLGFINNGQSTIKGADRLFYDLKFAFRFNKQWNFFASTNFMTQFMNGYLYGKAAEGKDSMVSAFMAPAYLTTSLGLEYAPNSYLSGRFGIGTLRQTIVLNETLSNRKMYGLENAGDKIRNQAVLQMVWNFDKDIMQNINLKVRSMTLWDYIKFDKAGSMVQRFDINFTLKVNKYINTNLQMVSLYDYDQDKDWQWSQVLALGILYKLEK